MFSEKECENKLNNLKKLQKAINNTYELNPVANSVFIGAVECFEYLIKEHFDNPPLKFEELEEGMWVWSNEFKGWFKIHSISNKSNIELQLSLIGNLVLTVAFNENQFYRKQVN